jgi:hypothetical protein
MSGTRAGGKFYAPGQEDRFKRDMILALQASEEGVEVFQIENEEKEPGFPDVIVLEPSGRYKLCEFKVSDERGVITFEPSQPRFYRRHPGLDITIIAWNVPAGRPHRVSASAVLRCVSETKTLKYRLTVRDAGATA